MVISGQKQGHLSGKDAGITDCVRAGHQSWNRGIGYLFMATLLSSPEQKLVSKEEKGDEFALWKNTTTPSQRKSLEYLTDGGITGGNKPEEKAPSRTFQ